MMGIEYIFHASTFFVNRTPSFGIIRLASLVAGNLVGSGSFLLPALLAPFGYISLLGWALASAGALALAGVFSTLGMLYPRASGPPGYLQETSGPFLGTLVGWAYWLLNFVSNGVLVITGVGYLQQALWPSKILPTQETLILQAGLVGIMGFIQSRGIAFVGTVEVILTILKILPLVMVPCGALLYIGMHGMPPLPEPLAPYHTLPLSSMVAVVAFKSLWSFVGIETGTIPSGDIKNPQRTIPIATMLGTLLAILGCMAGMAGTLLLVPGAVLSQTTAPYAEAFQILVGEGGGRIMAFATGLACIGSLNGWFLATIQTLVQGARIGAFPSCFKPTAEAYTPKIAYFLCCGGLLPILFLTSTLGSLEQFETITNLAVSTIVYIWIGCCIAVWVALIRKKGSRLSLFARIVGFGSSTLGIGFCIVALWGIGLRHAGVGIALFAVGLPWCLFQRYTSWK